MGHAITVKVEEKWSVLRNRTAFKVVRVIHERQQYHSTEKKCMKDRGNGGDKGADETVGTLATSSSSTTTLPTVSSITNFCSNPYSIPLLT